MKRLVSLIFACAALALASCSQPAPQVTGGGVRVEEAWIAAPLGATDSLSGFAVIYNDAATPDRLVSATSARAGEVMLHNMSMDGGVMTMKPLDGGLEVPAHGAATLSPDGAHLMIMGVTGTVAEGETVPIVLQFEKAGAVTADFKVSARAPMQH